jgi:HNH endonuclease
MRDEVAAAKAKRNVLATRFVEVAGPLPTPCRIWSLGKNGDGDGYVSFRKKAYRVHRLAWVLTNGAIPPGLVIRHQCDVPPCFENAADRIARGRQGVLVKVVFSGPFRRRSLYPRPAGEIRRRRLAS